MNRIRTIYNNLSQPGSGLKLSSPRLIYEWQVLMEEPNDNNSVISYLLSCGLKIVVDVISLNLLLQVKISKNRVSFPGFVVCKPCMLWQPNACARSKGDRPFGHAIHASFASHPTYGFFLQLFLNPVKTQLNFLILEVMDIPNYL